MRLLGKGSNGQIAYESLPDVKLRLYVNFEVNACRHVSVTCGTTGPQTDTLKKYILGDDDNNIL